MKANEETARGEAPGWCTHYRAPLATKDGQENITCKAGVKYIDIWKGQPFHVRPCFLTPEGRSKPGAAACELLRRPTAQEKADYAEFLKWRMGGYAQVMEQINRLPWASTPGKGESKIIECPLCCSPMRVNRLIYGPHKKLSLTGACSTPDCFSFMGH